MEFLTHLVATLVRTALKLVLIAAAVVFALSLLCVALLSLVWVLLKALLTGRKPAFVTILQRILQASGQFKRGGWGTGPSAAAGFGANAQAGEVVDVQAHEVRSEPALPDSRSGGKP